MSALHDAHRQALERACAAHEELSAFLDTALTTVEAFSALDRLRDALGELEGIGREWDGALEGLAALLMEDRGEGR